jgi:hypothetical protein
MTEPVPVDAPQNRQRILVIVAGIAAGIVLAYVIFKLLSGGGGSDNATTTTLGATGATITPRVTTTTTTKAPAETFEVFSNKNPFVALRGPVGSTSGSTSGTSTSGTSTSGTTSGTTSGSTASGTTSGGTVSGAGTTSAGGTAAEPRSTQRVSLMDVFTSGGTVMANVKVNDTVYKVTTGQTFATSYKATSLSASTGCGSFVYGDEPFKLCKGEEVLK